MNIQASNIDNLIQALKENKLDETKNWLYCFKTYFYEGHPNVKLKESCFKIGKTENKLLTRIKQYTNYKSFTDFICINTSSVCKRERILKAFLRKIVHIKPSYGQEYFNMDENTITTIFNNISIMEEDSINYAHKLYAELRIICITRDFKISFKEDIKTISSEIPQEITDGETTDDTEQKTMIYKKKLKSDDKKSIVSNLYNTTDEDSDDIDTIDENNNYFQLQSESTNISTQDSQSIDNINKPIIQINTNMKDKSCTYCVKKFTKTYNLNRHISKCKRNPIVNPSIFVECLKEKETLIEKVKCYEEKIKHYEENFKHYEENFKHYEEKIKQYEESLLLLNQQLIHSKDELNINLKKNYILVNKSTMLYNNNKRKRNEICNDIVQIYSSFITSEKDDYTEMKKLFSLISIEQLGNYLSQVIKKINTQGTNDTKGMFIIKIIIDYKTYFKIIIKYENELIEELTKEECVDYCKLICRRIIPRINESHIFLSNVLKYSILKYSKKTNIDAEIEESCIFYQELYNWLYSDNQELLDDTFITAFLHF